MKQREWCRNFFGGKCDKILWKGVKRKNWMTRPPNSMYTHLKHHLPGSSFVVVQDHPASRTTFRTLGNMEEKAVGGSVEPVVRMTRRLSCGFVLLQTPKQSSAGNKGGNLFLITSTITSSPPHRLHLLKWASETDEKCLISGRKNGSIELACSYVASRQNKRCVFGAPFVQHLLTCLQQCV